MPLAVDSPICDSSSLPPGPRLPRMLQAAQRIWRYAEFSDRGYARYGDSFTVRMGGRPTAVMTRDREVIRRLFTGDPLVKRHGNDLLRVIVGEQSLMVLEPPEHLARRKMLLPPFHGERIQSYTRLMERLVAAELDRLKAGDVVAILPIAQALALDVTLQAVLGISDVATRQRLRKIFDAMITPFNNFALFVPQLVRRSRWNLLAAPYWRLQDQRNALLCEHIAATRADVHLGDREDILAMMVAARDENGIGLSDEQLRDELATLLIAGHETTATAIAWGIELLVHNPAVMRRAAEGDDAYLEVLVKEVLRMHTPLPNISRHVFEPFPIGKWTVPPSVAILADIYGVHHDPRTYPQPHAFRPERFLEESGDGYAFLPFGGGSHRCLGAGLALLEIKIVLSEILRRFELAPVSSTLARPTPRGPMITPRGGARVRIVAERPTRTEEQLTKATTA
jgi:cytochrome P450 family 135